MWSLLPPQSNPFLPDSYCEALPVDGPPSFRGQAVKYVYKLTIGCQRVNSPIKLLRVPFRVLVLHGEPPGALAAWCGCCLLHAQAPDAAPLSPGLKDYQLPQDEAVAPSNPFLEEEEGAKKDSRLADLATELLMAAASRRSLRRSPGQGCWGAELGAAAAAAGGLTAATGVPPLARWSED